jgi:GSH-dependent disulfide-bond oxidoreductase
VIDFYTWKTPNGHKIGIMLEETALPYKVHPVNLGKNEQLAPDFLAINPNNKIPAIVDLDGPGGKPLPVFESGAILQYLAEKTGKFLSSDPVKRWETIQWLMFQMGGIGPMMGQAFHFKFSAAEKFPYAIERYTNETARLARVVNGRLADREFLAGDYSIADMANYPWLTAAERLGVNMSEVPHLKRWLAVIEARPAVKKGMNLIP